MADLPLELGGELDERLGRCIDVEGKIPRALEALGPVAGRDVLLLGRAGGLRDRQLTELGARVSTTLTATGRQRHPPEPTSADVVVALWDAFRGEAPEELAEAERVSRPGGRLLVVHDYGRDDVSRLRGDLPEYGAWGRRFGPFLGHGYRVRVIHCFWTFETADDASAFLADGFGDIGREVAATLRRPRLSYNVAVYHRDLAMAHP